MFHSIVENRDLWLNPSPEGPWKRIAVCSRWTDAAALAKRWDHYPAVVGPLRTRAGVDLLVRNLLANPQIRIVLIDGTDLLERNGAMAELMAVFEDGIFDGIREDAREEARARLFDADGRCRISVELATYRQARDRWCSGMWVDADRDGGAVVLPPPAPEVTELVPPGDPGDRVAGETLDDVYVRALKQVLTAGYVVGTQYGTTRELLNLVTVIRDPWSSIDALGRLGEGERHPVLGLSLRELEDYYRGPHGWIGREKPPGASYGYGERMHGTPDELAEDGLPRWGPDQFDAISRLLGAQPSTRAAFLTPWIPALDSGKESGRPCLVGAWFRITGDGCKPGDWYVTADDEEPVDDEPFHVWQLDVELRVPWHLCWKRVRREATGAKARAWAQEHCGGMERSERVKREPARLHLTVMFRSHDLFAAYPQNLGACCLWLGEEAEAHGVAVGTITCVSMSAHIYDRDWSRVGALWADYKRKGLRWDERSMFRVERDGEQLRAVAMTPSGDEVIGVFTAKTGAALRAQLEDSGLIQELGAALWLGSEIERVERS